MAALFGLPGAFSSQIGQRIEKATDSLQPSEDWMLILEICDMINETDEGPKDAIKAIRKRLTSSQKNNKCILYTLVVLEAAVKNCGIRFHKQVASKEFLSDLTKLLGGQKNQVAVSQEVQDKVLSLVQMWSDAFSSSPEFQQVRVCYETLKTQGYEFPAQNLDTLSPIYTPKKNESKKINSLNHQEIPSRSGSAKTKTSSVPHNYHQTAGRTLPQTSATPVAVNATPEQLAKLRYELDIVERNGVVFNEMLTELNPGRENPDDYHLLVELNKTCREMQKRILILVNSITNEEVTGVLLRINDDLNNTFLRYDRYEKNRKIIKNSENPHVEPNMGAHAHSPSIRPKVTSPFEPSNNSASLIDFNAAPSSTDAVVDDEFNMFAQSRSKTYATSRHAGSTYEDNINDVATEQTLAGALAARGLYPPIQSNLLVSQQPFPTEIGKEPQSGKNEFDEEIEDVEEWLKGTDLSQLKAQESANRAAILKTKTASQREEDVSDSLSRSEFDKFLNSRAQAGNIERQRTLPARPMGNLVGETHKDDTFGL
ncbi:TOM1-like protein 2 isoform X1 [Hydra vulgaris]|uniref:TOM1-like protein 2 n=1 Tax=Hydra vulgaris TaxID=6087 RepID=T2MAV9_HYDVU|nr:TOM1-like protein 2 [Hydra vulgaris]